MTGSDVQTQSVIDAGGLAACAALTRHERRNVRREACWAASNVAAGTAAQISQLAGTPGMVPNLVHQLDKGDWNVQKEAVWALSNMITSGGDDVVHFAVASKVLAPMVRMLKVDDPKIITVALEAVGVVLECGSCPSDATGKTYAELVEECGGVDALDALQQHANNDIYERSVELMETFYGACEEDENVAPVVAEGAKTFSFGSANTGPAFGFNSPGPATAAAGGFSFGFLNNAQFK